MFINKIELVSQIEIKITEYKESLEGCKCPWDSEITYVEGYWEGKIEALEEVLKLLEKE